MKTQHGWFSPTHSDLTREDAGRRPFVELPLASDPSYKVRVTGLTYDREGEDYFWVDKQYVGEVVVS